MCTNETRSGISILAPDFEVLFKSTPSPYLVLLPDSKFTIVEVNDAYLEATMNKREAMIGRPVFDVFPDNPSDLDANGAANLRASLERVCASRKADTMPIQKYDIPCKESETGFEARYWSPRNVPVFGKRGTFDFIIHRVEDVTDFVRCKQKKAAELVETEMLQARAAQMEAEIYQHSQSMEKAQEALRLSNDRYQMLTSILPVGVFHTDPEGNCFYVNPQWQEITGVDFPSLKDKRWFQLIHPNEQTQALESWKHSTTKKEMFKTEFRIPFKNGQERWVFAQIVPEMDQETDQVKGYVGSLTDITERKKVEEERKKQAEELTAIDRAKTIFFGSVSHELRTPLTLILGPIDDSLTDDKEPLAQRQRERLLLIRRNASRLLKLVNSLLDFSRLEAGHMKSCYEPTDLGQLTYELIGVFRSEIERAGLKLNVDVSGLDDELVYVDKDMWEKIVFNLLSNALKYTLKGAITATLGKKENCVELNIADTGIGIPAKELPRIFERFYRVEKCSGRSHEGAGIGLSLVQELVKLHGGDTRVASEEGKGSAFTIEIPLGKDHLPKDRIKDKPNQEIQMDMQLATAFVEEAVRWSPGIRDPFPPAQAKPASMAEPSCTHLENAPKKRILVADDNADMRDYLNRLLSPYWDVCLVEDGEAALVMILKDKPDLILSDVMMPKIDGFQLVRQLREIPEVHNIPIILLSAKAHEDSCVEGLQLGADDYLVKPFSNKELVTRIKTHLELGQFRAELERQVKERTETLHQANALLQKKISELKEAEAILAKSEENYRILATISPTGIFYCNRQGSVSYFNDKSCKLLGLAFKDAKGLGWIKAIHPEDQERVLAAWNDFSKGTAQSFKVECRYLHRDCSSIWVIVEVVAEDRKDAFVGTIADITELKDLEQKRFHAAKESENLQRKRAEEAEEHRKRQEQFIDTMCHELRNPLNGIYGNITLLETSVAILEKLIATIETPSLREKILQYINQDKESIQAIAACAQYQKVITDDVLSLSKLEAGKVELIFVEFNPNRIIKDVLNMLNVEIHKKNIQFDLNLPNDVLVNGDSNRLLQILLNLISNAVKFTPSNGKITIAWSPAASKESDMLLSFSIEDTGIGMSKEERDRIFDRFEQATARTSQEYGGSGLGLSITQNLVWLMGGTIEVESEKSKGTKFTFTITCKPLKLKEEVKPLLFSSSSSPKISRHILVAEDNLINQKLIKKLLEQRNHTCDFADNGTEAVRMVGEKSYDIILMDVEMPVMGGLEATKRIRTKEQNERRDLFPMPIIGISGNAREEQVEEAKKYGMDDYLTKPFRREVLFEKIDFYGASRDQYEASKSSSAAAKPKAELCGHYKVLPP